MPGALLSSKFFGILNTLSDSIFADSDFSFKLRTSCNTYSLIVFQNYLEVLVVLTQGFPLMMINIFLKVSAIDSESNNKSFLFVKHIFDRELFLFCSPSDFKVCQSSFALAIFSESSSSRYCFFLYLIVLWTSFLASL